MEIRRTLSASIFGAVLAFCAAVPTLAATRHTVPVTVEGTVPPSPPDRFVIMLGQGTVSAMPDTAVVSGGVVTHARRMGDAMHQNAETMAKVVAALKALGVTDKEITTRDFRFDPQYETDSKGNRDPSGRIESYTVSNQITVTLAELGKAGDALDALIESGANDSATVEFQIKDSRTLEMQAREKAGKDAMQRAQIYAREVGAELGPVRSIREGYSNDTSSSIETVVVTGDKAGTRLEAGEQSISASVTVVWTLK